MACSLSRRLRRHSHRRNGSNRERRASRVHRRGWAWGTDYDGSAGQRRAALVDRRHFDCMHRGMRGIRARTFTTPHRGDGLMLTRKRSLALIGAALVLPNCGGAKSGTSGAIRVGSKNFGENIIVGEIYAGALERAGFSVERHMNLGSTQIATAAMQRGDIDVYPEYTGTGLIDVLHLPPMRDAKVLFATVKRAYEQRYRLTWLRPSPVNDSQGLATTAALAA